MEAFRIHALARIEIWDLDEWIRDRQDGQIRPMTQREAEILEQLVPAYEAQAQETDMELLSARLRSYERWSRDWPDADPDSDGPGFILNPYPPSGHSELGS
jgi:hypothetical protein